MPNSMGLFTFSVLDRKHPYWANLMQKIGTNINSDMQNSMVVFTFAVLDRKYPFW